MNDEELVTVWVTLEPTATEARRIDAQVRAWLEAHDTSLLAEWSGLFQMAPLTAIGLVTVSAVALVSASPVLWLARVLL